jgi:hypothetical protein
MPWSRPTNDESLLGPSAQRFLLEHVVAERNLARNTQHGYRDARGDSNFGNEPAMREAEQRGQHYLFKLRLTRNLKRAI